ncbi:hypothetical protein Purlil1_10398 [Purpureocillium lilacinum]|uniref:Uncharacterized protein n=1 Tax=Purpureocillium lilacinum TaxID=33203 RepID=A0ABR0BMD4_PURLI|nr:hypothetical protein Purlil1_10398 [Purpureocillium lilacinum]
MEPPPPPLWVEPSGGGPVRCNCPLLSSGHCSHPSIHRLTVNDRVHGHARLAASCRIGRPVADTGNCARHREPPLLLLPCGGTGTHRRERCDALVSLPRFPVGVTWPASPGAPPVTQWDVRLRQRGGVRAVCGAVRCGGLARAERSVISHHACRARHIGGPRPSAGGGRDRDRDLAARPQAQQQPPATVPASTASRDWPGRNSVQNFLSPGTGCHVPGQALQAIRHARRTRPAASRRLRCVQHAAAQRITAQEVWLSTRAVPVLRYSRCGAHRTHSVGTARTGRQTDFRAKTLMVCAIITSPPVSGNGTTANSTQAEQPQTERACARGTDAAQLPSARWPWSGRVPERIPKGKRDKPSRQSKKAKPQARRNLESSRRSIDRRWIDKLFHFRVHFRPGSARVCCAVPPCFTDAGGRGSATVFLPKSRRSVDERVHGIHGSPVVVQPRRIREWAANKHPQQQQPPALGQMPTVRGDRWPKVKAQLAARPIAKYTGKGAHTSPLLLAPPTKPLAMRDTRRHAMCHARVAAFAAAASRLIGRAPRRDCPRGSDRIHPFINWAFSISQWEATASASPGAPPGPLHRWPPDQSLVALPPAISGPHQQPHGQLMSLARPPVPPPRRRRRRRRRRGLAPMPWTVVKNERLSRSLCGRAPRVSARASS